MRLHISGKLYTREVIKKKRFQAVNIRPINLSYLKYLISLILFIQSSEADLEGGRGERAPLPPPHPPPPFFFFLTINCFFTITLKN